MKNRRWSDNNKHFWPFTLSTGDCSRLGVVIDSGANDGGSGDCHIRLYLFSVTLICELPNIIRDWRVRHDAKSWSAEDIARIGRDWYEEIFPREYGFAFIDGALHTYFGAQTHSSDTDQNKVFFLPWRQWRFIRLSLYDLKGDHFWTERQGDRAAWEAGQAVKDACPKTRFAFEDFDGQAIIATTHIEEREWRFGEGLFRWLSWFRRPKIIRTLDLEFDKEVGPEKGSWKGGTVGTSIQMLPGELHEAAFRHYCEKEHRSKSRRYRVRFLGVAPKEAA